MPHTRTLLAIPIAILFLSACSSGGGGGDTPSAPNELTADNPLSVVNTPTPPEPTPVEPAPIVMQPPVEVDEPAVLTPVEDDPEPLPPVAIDPPEQSLVDTLGPIGELVGQVRIGWSFDGTETNAFTLTGVYGESDLTDEGILFTRSAQTTAQLGEEPALAGIDLALACSFVDEQNTFLCIASELGAMEGRASTYFLFPRLTDAASAGIFEFCEIGVSNAECVQRLLSSPDGAATITVTPSRFAARAAPGANGPDLSPYFAYAEQGTVDADYGMADSALVASARNLVAALASMPVP